MAETVPAFEAAGYPVAQWVKEMLAQGNTTFYQRDLSVKSSVITARSTRVMSRFSRTRKHIKSSPCKRGAEVARNAGASILDMGDGVALVEFHSPANSIH